MDKIDKQIRDVVQVGASVLYATAKICGSAFRGQATDPKDVENRARHFGKYIVEFAERLNDELNQG